jgi:hypothetical protein
MHSGINAGAKVAEGNGALTNDDRFVAWTGNGKINFCGSAVEYHKFARF